MPYSPFGKGERNLNYWEIVSKKRLTTLEAHPRHVDFQLTFAALIVVVKMIMKYVK